MSELSADETPSTALSAVERRERRKQRILANGEKRISAILQVDGENRQAPCIDGAPTAQTSTSVASVKGVTLVEPESESSSTVTARHTPKTLDFLDEATPDYLDKFKVIQRPKYMEFVDKSRFWIAISLGLILTLCTLIFGQIGNVLLPSLLLICSYETFVFNTKKLFYPRNGQLMKVIALGGLSENTLVTCGLLVEAFWEIALDLLVVTFGFMLSKLLLNAISGLLV